MSTVEELRQELLAKRAATAAADAEAGRDLEAEREARDDWRVRSQRTTSLLLLWWATAPECPMYGHATRDCRCRTTNNREEAEQHVAEQNALIRAVRVAAKVLEKR
ncbi:hypothetical protein [Agromyces seonyuensis]|uniref:Uncharacterized protein n=1 Tax=Agromyces seonyuensis TaxID=2662446 RepID=A0A6I4NVA2_9MICO|nr:hypothetical protein [Agromyces seonyuensis]MWB98308.1 hypothetical protein [Agromyces seonyuensis]